MTFGELSEPGERNVNFMRAVEITEYGGPEVYQIIEKEKPVPRQGEVLLKMIYAELAKPDNLMRTNQYPWTRDMLPIYPGQNGIGIVEQTGPGVDPDQISVGMPVYVGHRIVCGCLADYKTAPVEALVPLPKGISLAACTSLMNYFLVWGMLRLCFPGETANEKTLYIRGAAGPLGTAVIKMAPLLGIHVIASASSEEKCTYLREIGAEHVFCYTTADVKSEILNFTDGVGADIIMDQCVGEQFCDQFAYLAPMGEILIYSNLQGFPSKNVIEAMTGRFPECPGIRVFSYHYFDDREELLRRFQNEVLKLLRDGKLIPRTGTLFPLEDIVEAGRLSDSGSCCGGITIQIAEE